MTATLAALVLGTLLGALAAWRGAATFDIDALARTNYRGAGLPTAVGVLVPVVVLALAAVERLVSAAADATPAWQHALVPAVLAAVGYCLLGLFDDVAGVGQSGGFRGHVAALVTGRVTSGSLKLFGGAALGVLVASAFGSNSVAALLRDGAIVALAANLANLFDRAPGRTVKAASVSFVALALLARNPAMAAPATGIGAGLGLLRGDLRERYMLGDAGSNVLGALCGLAVLQAAPEASWRWAALVLLLAANLVSEVVSFTKVIDATPPLRWFDRLGSLRRP